MSDIPTEASCPICSHFAAYVGKRQGRLDSRFFFYFHCNFCRFSFIGNPRTDYAEIYSDAYYRGRGADPLADYVYELENPLRTIRNYEWRGVLAIFKELCPQGGRWLDFGCGAGGLVRFAREAGQDAVGFEEGWGASAAREAGIPVLRLEDLEGYAAQFDFVSAIEVFEHIADPVSALRQVRKLLKPGGKLFLTTGNAKPWRQNLLDWSYTSVPEVHISFFEPETLSHALRAVGFEPRAGRLFSGFSNILKFKVLKNLKFKNRSAVIDLLPWGLLARIVDAKYQTSAQPYGVAE